MLELKLGIGNILRRIAIGFFVKIGVYMKIGWECNMGYALSFLYIFLVIYIFWTSPKKEKKALSIEM